MKGSRTNDVILTSIPMSRRLKRYWVSKYERIATNCGSEEAVRKFKNLRVQVLSYLSDRNRKSNLDKYLSLAGFRTNGYLRQLFEYADTQPHYCLNFLKLYSADVKSSQTADQAAYAVKRRLESVKANDSVPKYLSCWIECACWWKTTSTYNAALGDVSHPFHRFAQQHSLNDWCAYWGKWRRIFRSGWNSRAFLEYKPVFPEIYKDFCKENSQSLSYKRDFADLVSMHLYSEESALSPDELEFVDGYLNEEVADALSALVWGETQGLEDLFQESTLTSGQFVGHVQHIHKKGGGTDLRDIAVPNRFIQNALVPCASRLYWLVRKLPKDATFDQDRFDTVIENRVTNDNLYQGSVDLSKATDNLPFYWGEYIISHLRKRFGLSSEAILLEKLYGNRDLSEEEVLQNEFDQSWSLFQTVARAKWEDEGFLLEWKVGQPLGSLPSFAVLAITHNLLVESMALSLGLSHSPYVILGDDIVLMNKKLRTRYIRELTSRGIPLSLHKSYEGRLSEFAGKTFVRKCTPFYCSDHSPITWNSLLDWQRTTGIRIPWVSLPGPIRRRITQMMADEVDELYSHPWFVPVMQKPSKKLIVQLASSAYNLALTCEVYGKGSHIYPIRDSAEMSNLISGYFERRITDSPTPEALRHTGITLVGNGRPVVLMNSRFADKDGYFQRFRPVELPAWYKAKVRPCATDAVIHAAIGSIVSEKIS